MELDGGGFDVRVCRYCAPPDCACVPTVAGCSAVSEGGRERWRAWVQRRERESMSPRSMLHVLQNLQLTTRLSGQDPSLDRMHALLSS